MKIDRFKLELNDELINEIITNLKSNELVYGSSLSELKTNLEQTFKGYHCILTSTGFSSIFLILKGLNIQNKKILVPCSSSCFAFVNAILASNNIPVFGNIEENSFNLDLQNNSNLEYDHIIYPNHYGITRKDKNQEIFIEDCAQSFFSSTSVGSNSRFKILSFYLTKGINGIDGGVILCKNKSDYDILKNLVSYNDQFEYNDIPRFNLKMNNINASVALHNIKKMKFKKARLEFITAYYEEVIARSSVLSSFNEEKQEGDVLEKFIIRVPKKEIKEVLNFFKENGVSLTKEYLNISNKDSICFNNLDLNLETHFSIPYYPSLTEEELKHIASVINKYDER